MSNQRFSITQAAAVSDEKISDAQHRTLCALGIHGDKNGWCFPKLKTIAALLHKSPQAVSKDVHHLKDAGYLQVFAQYKNNARIYNSYRLLFDTPSTPEVETPSTPEVETPSTPEVEAINAPMNAPMNAPRTPVRAPRTLKDPVTDLLERSEKAEKNGTDILTHFPEYQHPYVTAFCAAIHDKPTKREISRWRADFSEMYEAQYQPEELAPAVRYAIEQGTSTKSPGSILYALRALRGGLSKKSEPNYVEFQG